LLSIYVGLIGGFGILKEMKEEKEGE